MAEGFDRNRAVSLLQEPTRLIADTERSTTNTDSDSSTQRTVQETQSSSNTRFMCMPSTSTGINNTNRALGNFRNLFSPYGNSSCRSKSSTHQLASQPKKQKTQNSASSLYRCETWTHTFCC